MRGHPKRRVCDLGIVWACPSFERVPCCAAVEPRRWLLASIENTYPSYLICSCESLSGARCCKHDDTRRLHAGWKRCSRKARQRRMTKRRSSAEYRSILGAVAASVSGRASCSKNISFVNTSSSARPSTSAPLTGALQGQRSPSLRSLQHASDARRRGRRRRRHGGPDTAERGRCRQRPGRG